jgi:NADP-dependent 3-hydroxy acid dehydrogenase YdfG
MPENSLKGKTALVTGASSGIGRATALKLAALGAHVYATGRRQEALDELVPIAEHAGGKVTTAAFDIRDYDKFQGLIERAANDTGAFNILVNNAGLSHPDSIANGDPEKWREMMEVNILSLLAGSQKAIHVMRNGGFEGHIVNISSTAARGDASGVYGGTKAMVSSLATTMRKELEDDNIRIVNVCPGAVITNFARNFPPDYINAVLQSLGIDLEFKAGMTLPPEIHDKVNEAAPQLLLHADDIAKAVVYAVTQPINVDVFEITVRPAKSLELPDS